MLSKIGRLFVIKTRWEAWMVIYAIALGAVERGRHYLEMYPGFGGWTLALACTGVVFLAGARILDSVKPRPAAVLAGRYAAPSRRRDGVSRNRPTGRRLHSYSESPHRLRRD